MKNTETKFIKTPNDCYLPENEARAILYDFVAFAHRHVPDATLADIHLRLELEKCGINRDEFHYTTTYVVEGIYVESDSRGYLDLVEIVIGKAKEPSYLERLPDGAIWESFLADYEDPQTVRAMSCELLEPLVRLSSFDPLKVHSTIYVNLADPEIHLRRN